jgi:hypothetical protein
MKHSLVRITAACALSVASGLPFGAAARAQDSDVPLSDCLDAVGTYLTNNKAKDGSGDFASRSLISLTNGGHAFLTDSDQGGSAGFAPFTEGQGAWRCVANNAGVAQFRATVIDFTLVTPDWADKHIGRLDIEGTYDSRARKLSGTMTLYFVSLSGNPMNQADLKKAAGGSFDGYKITAP